MPTITVNEADLHELAARRADYFGQFSGLDAKRPRVWREYGWKDDLCFDDFYRAYERGGAGFGAVHKLLDRCWGERPRIKKPGDDKESDWEAKVNATLDDIDGWQKLIDLDRRNMVGRFAAVVYRIADSKKLNEPLGQGKLVDLVPLWENQVRVSKWQEDQNADDYGKPLMFEIDTSPPGQRDQQGRPRWWLKVHPSRLQLLAEGAVGDNFFDGVPLLRAGFNHLVDLEKISGGSAEGFWKNSQRVVKIEYDPLVASAAGAPVPQPDGTIKTAKEVHEAQARRLNSSHDATVVVGGGKAGTLDANVSDPSKPFEVAANLFSSSVQIPFTIQFGQQTGRLASDEDQKDMVARCRGRQVNVLTSMLRQMVRRLQACGALEAGDFQVEWKPLDEPTNTQKVETVGKMATADKAHFDAGGAEPLFDRAEYRKAAGYEDKKPADEFREGDPVPEPGAAAKPGAVPTPAPRPALKAA